MYNYQTQKQILFTESGQIKFLKVRDRVKDLLKQAGAFRMSEAISNVGGDTWDMLACIDRLVELKEIREVTDENKVASQHRVFTNL